MNFELTEDQASILDGLDKLLASLGAAPPTDPVLLRYARDLDAALAESGFLDIAREEGFGPLDGALIVERLARAAARGGGGGAVLDRAGAAASSPASARSRCCPAIDAAARYLPMAKLLLVIAATTYRLVDVDPTTCRAGRDAVRLSLWPAARSLDGLRADSASTTRRRSAAAGAWRIAAEAAGCMQARARPVARSRQDPPSPSASRWARSRRSSTAWPWRPRRRNPTKWLAFRAA